MDFPKLRNVIIFPVQRSGQSLLCLQDPQNISDKALFLPPPLYFIVSLFDGRHSILDIQTEYMRRFGEFLFTEKIEEIIRQLDDTLFLEGEKFQEALRQKEEGFKKGSFREAAFAGKSYEREPGRLKDQLLGYFTGPEGPGPLPERKEIQGLKGVIAPHIDFQRGGSCYAFAHREVWQNRLPDCFIIFGTAHTLMGHPFSLTRKEFITPLGHLEVDRELVDAIQSRCPDDLFMDEGIHRSEHSIEFQCIFLRYLFPEPAPVRIVPILSGSFHEAIERGISPMELPAIRQFIEAIKESVSSLGREVCYIASADLAHMGLQFGDRDGIGEYDLRILEEEDRKMLKHAEKVDEEKFFSSISEEQDRKRICGLPAIYAMLKVMEAKEGRLLKYAQAFTPETQSVVSFASMAFY
ncbi:MAG: AmmeMemoRadiSam system protein B [Thermodesulfobacteriota bacterium]|nr:AmmeMemoRadiSam system protein B [Thermodesulfobacteriota bacterium]